MSRDMTFFKNVYQVDGQFAGEPARIPVFYYDGTVITGIFLAKMSALKRMMPKDSYHPSPVMPGVGAIAITCFEYRDTDIRPYNEISISIPMTYKKKTWMPSAALLGGLMSNQFSVYVRHLPVTTQIALDGGVIVYNYPKTLKTIDFADTGNEEVVTLAQDGDLILRLTAKKIPTPQQKSYRYVTYPVKDDCAQEANVLVNAIKFGQSYGPSGMKLELGENHEIARELKSALLSLSPLMYQYSPRFQAILYGPGRLE